MTDQGKELLTAVGCIVLGISGWLLPFKWNLLRLRMNFAKHFSEKTNLIIAKVIGTLLISGGIILLIDKIFNR
jgi:hypothetical protein